MTYMTPLTRVPDDRVYYRLEIKITNYACLATRSKCDGSGYDDDCFVEAQEMHYDDTRLVEPGRSSYGILSHYTA